MATEISKTIRHHFPDFYLKLCKIDDPRKRKHYGIDEMVFGAVSLFLFKSGSRNAYQNLINERKFRKNFRKLFGLRIPKPDAVAGVLKEIPEEALEDIKTSMVHRLIENRVFDKWRYKGKFMVAIDGSGIATFDKEHCERCLKKTYNRGKQNEKTVYYHNVLEAKLVTSNGFSISLATQWIENPEGEYNKQDCERRAFERLAAKLKKQYPRTAICLCADGLYPYDGFFNTCKTNQWDYIVTLKEKSLKRLWKQIRLRNRECLRNNFIEHSKQINQEIQWIAQEEFSGHTHNWIQIREKQTNTKEKTSYCKLVYLTNLEVNSDTAIDVCNNGRLRWKIEKQGFDQQKNHGYNISHKFCRKSYKGMKNFYQCCQIAHIINQLVEKRKDFPDFIPGKKTVTHLWFCLQAFMCFGHVNQRKVHKRIVKKTQMQYIE